MIAGLGLALLAALIAVAFIGVPAGSFVSGAITGIDPRLAHAVKIGEARIKLLPRPVLTAGNIAVFDPHGPAHELLEIRKAHLAGTIAGLFTKNLHFSALTLSGVKVFAGPHLESLAKFADEKALKELRDTIDEVKIQNASVVRRTPNGNEESLAGSANAALTLIGAGAPNLRAEAELGRYAVKIAVASEGQQASPGALFPIHVSANVDKDGSALMNGSFLLTQDAAAKGFTCRLVSGSIQGRPFTALATIDTSHKRPAIALNAAFESLTLPAANLKPEMPPNILGGVLGNNLLDLSFKISANKVTGPSIELAPAYAEGSLSGGKLTVDVSKTQAYGGSLNGQFTVQKGEEARSNFELRGAQLPKLLTSFSWHDAISGSLDADGRLAAWSTGTAAEPLSGDVSLKVKNGAVAAPALAKIIQSFLSNQSKSILNGEGKLPFSLDAQRININHGIATADNMLFKSSLVRALGHGRADLSKGTLDFVFAPQVVSSESPPSDGNKVRVAITGTFERPEVSATGLGGAIIDKLESEGEDALGLNKEERATVRDAIKTFQDWLNSEGNSER